MVSLNPKTITMSKHDLEIHETFSSTKERGSCVIKHFLATVSELFAGNLGKSWKIIMFKLNISHTCIEFLASNIIETYWNLLQNTSIECLGHPWAVKRAFFGSLRSCCEVGLVGVLRFRSQEKTGSHWKAKPLLVADSTEWELSSQRALETHELTWKT